MKRLKTTNHGQPADQIHISLHWNATKAVYELPDNTPADWIVAFQENAAPQIRQQNADSPAVPVHWQGREIAVV